MSTLDTWLLKRAAYTGIAFSKFDIYEDSIKAIADVEGISELEASYEVAKFATETLIEFNEEDKYEDSEQTTQE